jgi:hypothetical protein
MQFLRYAIQLLHHTTVKVLQLHEPFLSFSGTKMDVLIIAGEGVWLCSTRWFWLVCSCALSLKFDCTWRR